MNKTFFFLLYALAHVVNTSAISSDDDNLLADEHTISFYEIIENVLFIYMAEAVSDTSIERSSVKHIIINSQVEGNVIIANFEQVQNIFYDSNKVNLTLDASIQANLIDLKDSILSIENYPELIGQKPKDLPDETISLPWSDWVSQHVARFFEYFIVVP